MMVVLTQEFLERQLNNLALLKTLLEQGIINYRIIGEFETMSSVEKMNGGKGFRTRSGRWHRLACLLKKICSGEKSLEEGATFSTLMSSIASLEISVTSRLGKAVDVRLN
jgi:hypothetical protein